MDAPCTISTVTEYLLSLLDEVKASFHVCVLLPVAVAVRVPQEEVIESFAGCVDVILQEQTREKLGWF